MLEIRAVKHYLIQSGTDPNFSKRLLGGLPELSLENFAEPATLLLEDNAGGQGRPAEFARLEVGGVRLKHMFDRTLDADALLKTAQIHFDFTSPVDVKEGEN